MKEKEKEMLKIKKTIYKTQCLSLDLGLPCGYHWFLPPNTDIDYNKYEGSIKWD